MRFLHLADVHLDTPFAGRTDALRRRLREASREALDRAFAFAREEDLDAVLVAGDLFDGQRLSFETERFLVDRLRELTSSGVAVVYATGNHDPGRGGLRAHALPWPEGVVVVGGREPTRVPVRRGDRLVGWVTAAGHASERETMDLSLGFRRPDRPGGDGAAEVALLHTQVVAARDAEAHALYAPSELEHLRRAGFDYWGLGHVHTRQCLSEAPPVHYPGNLMGRTHGETGAKGGLLVDLREPAAPETTFRAFAPVRWETVRVGGLEAADTLDRLVVRAREAWDAARGEDRGEEATEWMVRIVFQGATPLWRALGEEEERGAVAEEIRHALHALDVTVEAPGVHPVVPVDEHRERTDVLGAALRLAGEIREGRAPLPELAPGELAGLQSDDPERVEAYVRSLLEGAEGELLSRLLRARS